MADTQRYEQDLRAAEDVLAWSPDDRVALQLKAQTLNRLRRSEESLATWERVLAHKPKDAKAKWNRARILHSLSRYEEAAGEYCQLPPS